MPVAPSGRGRRKRHFCACSQRAHARNSTPVAPFPARAHCEQGHKCLLRRPRPGGRAPESHFCACSRCARARNRKAAVGAKSIFARVRGARVREIARPRSAQDPFLRVFAVRVCAKSQGLGRRKIHFCACSQCEHARNSAATCHVRQNRTCGKSHGRVCKDSAMSA